jgi:glycosyltransferase involved in cell wall biosynthesis
VNDSSTAILHYSAPPVIGGVEAVIDAHVHLLTEAGYPVAVIAGQGDDASFPNGTNFIRIPELDSQYPQVLEMNPSLEAGTVPVGFEDLVGRITAALKPVLSEFKNVIVHNIFTKHFNLPLTVGLYRLLDAGGIGNCIAWCHDFTWTSPHSGHKVHPGYPWDLLRTYRPEVTYVVVSQRRQRTLAKLLDVSPQQIKIVYNGVDPVVMLGLRQEGWALIQRLGVLDSDLVLLMPVRVTQAKNIELALKVVVELKKRHSNPKLVLTGPPDPHDPENMDYYEFLRKLRGELNVEKEMRFVFESGPDPEEPYIIDLPVVGDLYRVSDLMFMPSHREGFGMPVLEAGLVGIPVVSTAVPAAEEIGGRNVFIFSPDDPPEKVAELILTRIEVDPVYRHKRQVRKEYTWKAIFQRDIETMLRK